MLPNPLILLATAFLPFILGFIWFHPKVFGGNTWYNLAKMQGADRSKVSKLNLVSTLIFNFFISFALYNVVVHQMSIFGLVGGDLDNLKTGTAAAFLAEYGESYKTFGHGMLHGIFPATAFFVMPILAYVTIFEKKSWRYFFVYLGFWGISLALMGGILSKWGPMPI